MNTLPSYSKQFNKITEAYIKGEIKPNSSIFCFCGNLCDNKGNWAGLSLYSHNDYKGYVGNDFVRMETALFEKLYTILNRGSIPIWNDLYKEGTPEYEDALFEGMCDALEVLKQIHIERGGG